MDTASTNGVPRMCPLSNMRSPPTFELKSSTCRHFSSLRRLVWNFWIFVSFREFRLSVHSGSTEQATKERGADASGTHRTAESVHQTSSTTTNHNRNSSIINRPRLRTPTDLQACTLSDDRLNVLASNHFDNQYSKCNESNDRWPTHVPL